MTKQIKIFTVFTASALITGSLVALPLVTLASGPWLYFNTNVASPGTTVLAQGGGFAPNESVSVSIAGGQLGGVTADSRGSFSNDPVVVPTKPVGTYTALATGDRRNQASANFYISGYFPHASPSAWYVLPGQTLSFSGTGFAQNEAVTVGSALGSAASSTANVAGNFSTGSMVVPFNWQGSTRTFTVVGQTSGAHIPLTLTIGSFYPQIEPSTYYVARNTSVSVSGHGFAPHESVVVMVNGVSQGQSPADASGNVSFAVTTPSSGDSFMLSATGSWSNKSSARTIHLHI